MKTGEQAVNQLFKMNYQKFFHRLSQKNILAFRIKILFGL